MDQHVLVLLALFVRIGKQNKIKLTEVHCLRTQNLWINGLVEAERTGAPALAGSNRALCVISPHVHTCRFSFYDTRTSHPDVRLPNIFVLTSGFHVFLFLLVNMRHGWGHFSGHPAWHFLLRSADFTRHHPHKVLVVNSAMNLKNRGRVSVLLNVFSDVQAGGRNGRQHKRKKSSTTWQFRILTRIFHTSNLSLVILFCKPEDFFCFASALLSPLIPCETFLYFVPLFQNVTPEVQMVGLCVSPWCKQQQNNGPRSFCGLLKASKHTLILKSGLPFIQSGQLLRPSEQQENRCASNDHALVCCSRHLCLFSQLLCWWGSLKQ